MSYWLSTKTHYLRLFLRIVIPSLCLALAVLFYYHQVWGATADFVMAIDHCPVLFCDFTRQYYPTGQELFVSATPTNGYFYSLSFALFLAVLGRFELETAVQLWYLFQIVTAVLLLIFSAHPFRQHSPRAYFLYLTLFLLAVPLLHNFKWGQVSTFITACIFGALFFYRQEHKTVAALLLALATATKYYPGLFLLYFLLKKDWRFSLTYLAACLILIILIPLLLLGFGNNLHFYQFVSERIAHARSSWLLTDINSQYLANVMTRLAQSGDGRLLWQLLGYGLTGITLLLIYRLTRTSENREILVVFSLLFLIMPFVIETSWPHYFVYLPFSQLLVYLHLAGRPKSWAWLVVALLLILSMFLMSMLFFPLLPDWKVYSHYGVLFFANLLALCSTLAMVWSDYLVQGASKGIA